MPGGEDKIIYREQSYIIMGIVFEVFNNLGFGYQEKIYQKALEAEFARAGLVFKAQSSYVVCYKGNIIGRYFVDFIIDNKIVLEIKQGDHFSKKYFDQVNSYLKTTKLKLAILINFTSKGVKFKRLINII